jgi:ketosteroid isomerase-like protein
MNPASLAAVNAPASPAPLGERFAATPRLACEGLAKALNAGDLQGATRCFAPAATLIWADGSAACGQEAIAMRLGELISARAEVALELRGVLVSGDLALAHERWALSYEGVPDRSLEPAPSPSLVMRLLEDEWKLAIAAPWGQAASSALEAVWP